MSGLERQTRPHPDRVWSAGAFHAFAAWDMMGFEMNAGLTRNNRADCITTHRCMAYQPVKHKAITMCGPLRARMMSQVHALHLRTSQRHLADVIFAVLWLREGQDLNEHVKQQEQSKRMCE